MAENFDPITGLDGADNMGGYKDYVLWVPKYAVSAVPTLPKKTALSTDDDLVTAAGAFVFKDAVAGKPIFFECTPASVKFDTPNQGEIEGQSYAPAGEFYRAGNKKAYAAFARKYNNTPGYLILEDMDGNQIIVGQRNLECYLKPSFEGGQKRADRRGYKITFSTDSITPVAFLGTPIDVDALID
jgi:hypothetical protein